MLRVRDFMTRDVYTLEPGASAAEAWALCRDHRIRHVPIVEDGRLVGMVSDRDLRDVSPPRGEGQGEASTGNWVRIADMMTRDLYTIDPLSTIEEAARLIHEHRIGCLPVVADDELAGIVTSSDMMRTLIELAGAGEVGTWIEVEVPNEPGTLANITDVIRDRKVNIASVFLGRASRETYRTIVLRLETTNPTAIVQTLEDAGYRVTTVEPTGGGDKIRNPYEA